MAYMAAAGSSFVAIISAIMMRSSSTVPQSLFRLGTLGIAASAAYGVYLTGIRSSSYWKRSVWLLVAECKQIVDALRQDHNTSSPISYSIFWEGDQDQKKTETESNSIKLQN